MKTLLYIGAGLDLEPILNFSDVDKFIYTIDKPFDELNDHIIDDFISSIKKHGYTVKLTMISYYKPFYIKCYNKNKTIKYFFNILIPTSNMLKYESINFIKINSKYDSQYISDQLKGSLSLLQAFDSVQGYDS